MSTVYGHDYAETLDAADGVSNGDLVADFSIQINLTALHEHAFTL
jgi:hypothetical protein